MKINRKFIAVGLALVIVAATSITAIAASSSDTTTTNKSDTKGMKGYGGMIGGLGQSLEVVKTLTGLTSDEIQTLLKDGKTLAEIAATKNVSQDDLVAALVKDTTAKLDTLKTNGKITQSQYDKCLTDLKDRITKEVTETRPAGLGRGGMFVGLGQSLDVVKTLTGLTSDEIQALLKDGKTLAAIAATKNVSQDDLVAAVVKDTTAKLDTLKTNGKITQDQYDKFIADLKNRITKEVTETRPEGKGIGGPGQSLDVVKTLTGLTSDEIQTRLKDGKTLAAIAATKNVSQDDLIAALVKDATAKLDSAKTDGKITQSQYDKCLTDLKDRITKEVTSTRPEGPGRGGHGRGMHGGPGMGSGTQSPNQTDSSTKTNS
ncbi:MAG: hypothetical protein ACM3NT_05405 [Methylocystaceae bacterium]